MFWLFLAVWSLGWIRYECMALSMLGYRPQYWFAFTPLRFVSWPLCFIGIVQIARKYDGETKRGSA